MEDEVWKLITDMEKFEVSNLGKIRNAKTKRLRKLQETDNGYLTFSSGEYKNNVHKFVHRLVGFMFIPNTNNCPTIHHENGNRKDNRVVNLRWATMLEQNQPENKKTPTERNMGNSRCVNRIDKKNGEILQTYESCVDAGLWVVAQGISKSPTTRQLIGDVCRGIQKGQQRHKTAFGFIWSYVKVEIIKEEIWEPLPPSLVRGTTGYIISNKGRLKGQRYDEKIISGYVTSTAISVRIGDNVYILRRLVASVFIENPDGLECVTNWDKDKHNNCVENLRWISRKDASFGHHPRNTD